jgi:hypothetical protein
VPVSIALDLRIFLEYKASLLMRIRHAGLYGGGKPGENICAHSLVLVLVKIKLLSNNGASD